jgi:hypothetical protein
MSTRLIAIVEKLGWPTTSAGPPRNGWPAPPSDSTTSPAETPLAPRPRESGRRPPRHADDRGRIGRPMTSADGPTHGAHQLMTVVEIAAMMRVSRATAYASCTPVTCPRSAATARVNPAAEVVPVAEPPLPLTFEALSTPELCLGLVAQLPRVARRGLVPRPLQHRGHARVPARRARTTRARRVHPLARHRRPRRQRPGPVPQHRPVTSGPTDERPLGEDRGSHGR